ncbi:MAG: DNA-binding NarL/FixJ family response regulator [Litorivivens sp.]|jgi:DNA-binding NarL/FixJ family response regulator
MAKNQFDLTQRQRDVLLLLRLGKTNDEIAKELEISVNTVKTHLKSLYIKLEVSNRTQATFKGNAIL